MDRQIATYAEREGEREQRGMRRRGKSVGSKERKGHILKIGQVIKREKAKRQAGSSSEEMRGRNAALVWQSIGVAGKRLSKSSLCSFSLPLSLSQTQSADESRLRSPRLSMRNKQPVHETRERRRCRQTKGDSWMEQMQDVAGEDWRQDKWSCHRNIHV